MTARAVRRRPWLRWALPVVVVLVGVVFLATTFANSLFAVGPAFEEMIDDFRPLLQDDALAQAQADLDGLAAVSTELDSMVGTMAGALEMTAADFQAMMGEQFPAVATGAAELGDIGAGFSGLVGLLGDQQALFFSADEIPTADLPATTVPWGILAAGLVAIATGFAMYQWRRGGAWLAIGLGALLVVVPLVLSLLAKSADADELNDNLEPVYTVATVQSAQEALSTVSMMGTEMQTVMLPALAEQLGMGPGELDALIGSDFPVIAATLEGMSAMLDRFGVFVETFNNNLDNYDTLRPVAFLPIVRTLVVGGIVVALAGAALALDGRRREEPVTAPERKERIPARA